MKEFRDYVVCLIEKYGKLKFTGTVETEVNEHTILCRIYGHDGVHVFDFMVDNDENKEKVAEMIIRDSAFYKMDKYQLHQFRS